MVAEALLDQPAWVGSTPPAPPGAKPISTPSPDRAFGIRIPKVESAADVEWVTDRAPGTPIICAIESARGVLAAQEIAAAPGVRFLAMGGVDLQRDLNTTGGNLQTLYARSHLVLASRAAGIEPPIDSVFPVAGRHRRASGSGGVRPIAGVLRQVGDPPTPAARSCTRCSPPPRRRSNGHCRFSTGFERGRRWRLRPAQRRVRRPPRRGPGAATAGDRRGPARGHGCRLTFMPSSNRRSIDRPRLASVSPNSDVSRHEA